MPSRSEHFSPRFLPGGWIRRPNRGCRAAPIVLVLPSERAQSQSRFCITFFPSRSRSTRGRGRGSFLPERLLVLLPVRPLSAGCNSPSFSFWFSLDRRDFSAAVSDTKNLRGYIGQLRRKAEPNNIFALSRAGTRFEYRQRRRSSCLIADRVTSVHSMYGESDQTSSIKTGVSSTHRGAPHVAKRQSRIIPRLFCAAVGGT